MTTFIIYKNDPAREDLLWLFSDLFAISICCVAKQYIVFTPIILLISLLLLNRAILWVKWHNSYAIKIDESVMTFNHNILFNKIEFPITSIQEVNLENQSILLKAPIQTSIFHIDLKKITFSNLSDNEKRELLLYLHSIVMKS